MTASPRSALNGRDAALVAVGGATGAGTRWAVVEATMTSSAFPWWTLVVNVVGCLVLGFLSGGRRTIGLVAGVGFCGGLTTFSTFSLEIALLADDGRLGLGAAYAAISVVGGIVAVLLGRAAAESTRR